MTSVAIIEDGVLELAGRDRVEFVHRLSTNDLAALTPERATTTLFTNEKGRIIDWTWVLPRPDRLLLRTSAGRAPRLAEWLERFFIIEDVSIADKSGAYRVVVAQGPDAASVLELSRAPEQGELLVEADALAVRGLRAYGERIELLVASEQAERRLERALAGGARRIGADALEQLRLLAGVPSPSHEFKEEVNPLELRITEPISWTKGCYIGQEVIARIDSYDKLARQLIGFEADVPVQATGDVKLQRAGRPLGRVTSLLSTDAGTLGLAVVKREAASPGEAELVGVEPAVPVRLVDRPFWSR